MKRLRTTGHGEKKNERRHAAASLLLSPGNNDAEGRYGELSLMVWAVPTKQIAAFRKSAMRHYFLYHESIQFLITDTSLGSASDQSNTNSTSPKTTTNLVLLHPRVQSEADMDRDCVQECRSRLGATLWTEKYKVKLTATVLQQISTVVFYSKANASTIPSPRPGLPNEWRRILSNFWHCDLQIDQYWYPSVEHYFQASKALCSSKPSMADQFRAPLFDDVTTATDASDNNNKTCSVGTPEDAKRAGGRKAYQVHGAALDMALWNLRRDECMLRAIAARYEQDFLFRDVLNSTTKSMYLLHFERSGAKSYWGGNFSKQNGEMVGTNRLGTILMQVRDAASKAT